MFITDEEIQSFEDFFSSVKLPETPYKLIEGETITDFDKFISGHISVLRSHKEHSWIEPYLNRLEILKSKLKIKI